MSIINVPKLCMVIKKIKKWASSQNWKSLTKKTKIWHNNQFSRRFGKYSKGITTKMKHSLLPSWFVYLLIERGQNERASRQEVERIAFNMTEKKIRKYIKPCNLQP